MFMGSPVDREEAAKHIDRSMPAVKGELHNYWSYEDDIAGIKGGGGPWEQSWEERDWFNPNLNRKWSIPEKVKQHDMSESVSGHSDFQRADLAEIHYSQNLARKTSNNKVRTPQFEAELQELLGRHLNRPARFEREIKEAIKQSNVKVKIGNDRERK